MDALSELPSLPPEQKVARGLAHTPAEIAQQPDTWLSTYNSSTQEGRKSKSFSHARGAWTLIRHQM